MSNVKASFSLTKALKFNNVNHTKVDNFVQQSVATNRNLIENGRVGEIPNKLQKSFGNLTAIQMLSQSQLDTEGCDQVLTKIGLEPEEW